MVNPLTLQVEKGTYDLFQTIPFTYFAIIPLKLPRGLAERFNAAVLKTVVLARVPGVRIPHPLLSVSQATIVVSLRGPW